MAFYTGFYANAIIVHTQANQLLPQLLMEKLTLFVLGILFFTLSVRASLFNVLFPLYLEESLLDFHQTLQTCSYMQHKYF